MRPAAEMARTRSVRPAASSSGSTWFHRGEGGLTEAATVGAGRAHLVDVAAARRDDAEAVAPAAQHHAEAREGLARELQLRLGSGA